MNSAKVTSNIEANKELMKALNNNSYYTVE
jgi:hypothetical protein